MALHRRIAAGPTIFARAERNKMYLAPPFDEEDRLCQEKVGLSMPKLMDKVIAGADTHTEIETEITI
jgi:hypothetical protein